MNGMDPESDRDAALDARLRAAFAPPRDVQRIARDVLARSGAQPPVSRWRQLRPIAAILIVAAGLGGLGWFAARDGRTSSTLASGDAGHLHLLVAAELGEPLSCNSPEESSQLFTRRGGTPLDYRGGARVPLQGPLALPPGWSGDPAATVLAGHFEGRVVVVVIEAVEAGGSGFDSTDELRVHRRELGGYVLHEISSGRAPLCLDAFFLGDIP